MIFVRVLVVDDNVGVHRDFKKILSVVGKGAAMAAMERELFGDVPSEASPYRYELYFAESGRQALEEVQLAVQESRPFTMAFVDMRMPGWDGTETIEKLWTVQPDLEVAICSAYMDYSWHEVLERLKRPGIRLIRKPWSSAEVLETVQELVARKDTRHAML